jgi:hypothetical protein
MRKVYLFVICIFISVSFSAQNWCPPGARWLYKVYSVFLETDALTEYVYVKDTLIQGKTCKQISGTYAGSGPQYGNHSYTVVPGFRKYYTFEQNNVVYLYNGSDFDTIVNFNAIPGDKWRGPSAHQCTERAVFTVKDTGATLLNGVTLKMIGITSIMLYQSSAFSFTITERTLQAPGEFIDLFPFYCFSPGESDPLGGTFVCYSDNEIGTYNPGADPCIEDLGVQEEVQGTSFFCGPNPFNGSINVMAERACRIRLVAVDGTTVKEIDSEGAASVFINTADLPPALYLVQYIESGMIVQQAKMVKE